MIEQQAQEMKSPVLPRFISQLNKFGEEELTFIYANKENSELETTARLGLCFFAAFAEDQRCTAVNGHGVEVSTGRVKERISR